MARNTAAKNLLQNKISNSKGNYNPHNGKLAEDDDYTPIQPKKAAEKSAAVSNGKNLRTRGQKAEVVGNTGAKNALQALMERSRKSRAIRKEMNAVGKSLMRNKNADLAAYQQAAQKQVELQKQLPGASFAAGFLGSMGGDVAKIAAKTTKNQKAKENMLTTLQQLQETQEANKGAGMAGAMAGELTKAGALYGTVGAAAEEAALKGVGKVAGGKALGKAGTFATRMLGQQAADTVVNTPMTIAKGMADGKSKKEIAKDIGKQEAMDAAFNVGMGAIGEGAKALNNARNAKKASNAAEVVEHAAKTQQAEIPKLKQAEEIKAEVTKDIPKTKKGRELLRESELPANLLEEYRKLNDADWMEAELRKVSAQHPNDPQKVTDRLAQMRQRSEALEEMLGIRTNKVKDNERRILAEGGREISNILSISKKAEKDETKALLQKAFGEGKLGGISKETRDSIFDSLFEKGSLSNADGIDQDLKQMLRSTKLRISEVDAANIADFGKWKKGTFGKLGGISTKNGTPVDVKYAELSGMYPDIFPESITHPAEQLERIRDVAEGMVHKQIPLTETVGAEEKAMMRQAFDEAMDKLEASALKMNDYTRSRAETQTRKLLLEGANLDYGKMTTDDIKGLYDERYRLQKAAEKLRAKKMLTEGDKLTLQKLLRGEIGEEEARSIAGRNGDDLMELFAAEKPLYAADKSIENYKNFVGRNRYESIADVVGDLPIRKGAREGWKDWGPLRYARETQERILDGIAPNKETAERVNKSLFAPIHENEKTRILFMNDFKDRIEKIGIRTKNEIPIQLPGGTGKTSESALVQWLGENRYLLRQLEAKKDIPAASELYNHIKAVESSLTKEQLKRIDAGIEELTSIYKEIHPKINEVLIRNGFDPVGYIEGYFPHMNFDDPTNAVEAVAKKLGFDFASKELPMDIAGRTETFRPGKKYSGNLLTREGTQTDYDALRAFDQYIDNISVVIYHTDDIKNLRTYEDYMRYTLSDDGIKEKVDAVRNDAAKTTAEKRSAIDEIYEGVENHSLQNYVNNIRLYTDLLAGKKHNLDRNFEKYAVGRKFYKVMNEVENRVAGNMVAGNIGSALTNVIPITQGMGNMSTVSNLKGLGEALAYMTKGEMDELTKKSAFLATREGNKMLYRTGLQKASEFVGAPMEIADKFCTQAVWRSRFYDNVKKGLSETAAIKEADDYARGLFAGRSKGAMPTAFSSKTLKPLTMFQLEVNNQISYLMKDVPKNAQGNVAKMARAYGSLVIGAYIYNDVYEKLTGRRSALDPFGMANDAVGDFTGRQVRNTLDILGDMKDGNGLQIFEETKQMKPSQALAGLTEDIGGNVPFVGGLLFGGGRIPVQSAIPSFGTMLGAVGDMASGDMEKEKAMQTIKKEAEKPLWYLAMPFAGGQVRKTLQGADTMMKGGSYTQGKDGKELQYTVDQNSKGDWAKSILFGKWSTPEAQGYLENKNSLSAKNTETYERLRESGVKNTAAFDAINLVKAVGDNADKRKEIRKSGLSKEQQGILFYDLAANEKEKEMLDRYGADARAEMADVLSRLSEHEKKDARMNMLRQENISDRMKRDIFRNMISDNEYDGGDMDQITGAGMSMDEFLQIKGEYTRIRREGGKQKDQMKSWLDAEGYSYQKQKAVIEAFGWKWTW